MRKNKRMKLLFLTLCAAFLFACNNKDIKINKKSGNLFSSIVDNTITPESLKEEQNLTTMKFNMDTINYGTVTEDTDNLVKFTVYNTGKNPLRIEKVSASCGCTTVKEPENEIPVGGSDQIEVNFHPKVGQLNSQEKTVTVLANTEPQMKAVKIKAFVVPIK